MKVTRKNVFETNSSSTHSICISKQDVKSLPKSIHFGFGEYGWENDEYCDTENYLYTAINECGMTDCIDKIKKILDKHNIIYTFDKVSKGKYFEGGYVDHCEELREFIEDICNDENKLLRYLFGNSVIYTGNDNSNDNDDMCYSAEEFIYDDDYNKIPNPNHDSEHYEYYFKGN